MRNKLRIIKETAVFSLCSNQRIIHWRRGEDEKRLNEKMLREGGREGDRRKRDGTKLELRKS